MSSGYRETALACPVCASMLDPRSVGDAVVDVCPGCAGVWVDWFDGELVLMVKGAAGVTPVGPSGRGDWACPRCARPLTREGYLDTGAIILRCAECSGAFVPRVAADRLAGRPDPEVPMEKGPLDRLVAVLRTLLGLAPS
jgi:Transcription factor zinc-finger